MLLAANRPSRRERAPSVYELNSSLLFLCRFVFCLLVCRTGGKGLLDLRFLAIRVLCLQLRVLHSHYRGIIRTFSWFRNMGSLILRHRGHGLICRSCKLGRARLWIDKLLAILIAGIKPFLNRVRPSLCGLCECDYGLVVWLRAVICNR
jgi:hypothetical protein